LVVAIMFQVLSSRGHLHEDKNSNGTWILVFYYRQQ
jgi:hypothetical protein